MENQISLFESEKDKTEIRIRKDNPDVFISSSALIGTTNLIVTWNTGVNPIVTSSSSWGSYGVVVPSGNSLSEEEAVPVMIECMRTSAQDTVVALYKKGYKLVKI